MHFKSNIGYVFVLQGGILYCVSITKLREPFRCVYVLEYSVVSVAVYTCASRSGSETVTDHSSSGSAFAIETSPSSSVTS